jgi:hypothetical protein
VIINGRGRIIVQEIADVIEKRARTPVVPGPRAALFAREGVEP